MLSYLLVFLGGGTGAVLRFIIGPGLQALSGLTFPIGTFVVNVTGCFIIGLLAGLAEAKSMFSLEARQFIFVGILGGYTTFSTFGLETFQLIREGQILLAVANAAGQVIVGLLLVWAGFIVAKLF